MGTRQREILQDRGALPKEEGDIVTQYKAMHEENVLSSSLREDVEDEEERRRCTNPVSAEVFDIYFQ